MPCIEKIYSVSVIVGTKQCNAKCPHCIGIPLRSAAPKVDEGTPKNLIPALRLSARYGGWSVSLTGSGEPTLSPNAITETLQEMRDSGDSFPFVNLFTNGIELVRNREFTTKWLPLWKSMGLTSVAISIHSVDHDEEAKAYGLAPDQMPALQSMINVVKLAGLTPRITLLLHKGYVDNAQKYKETLDTLKSMGIFMVTSWPLAVESGGRCEATPSRLNMLGIRWWLWRNSNRVLGHAWGGSVWDYDGMSVRLTDFVSKHKPGNNFIRQLVVFQDGTVAYSWFQKGAFCIK